MKYAYYGAVSGEAEKLICLERIRASVGQDRDYYKTYLEMAPGYNCPVCELKALRNLRAAIRRGKVDKVVILDPRSLAMGEDNLSWLLHDFLGRGVRVAFGDPDNVRTGADINRFIREGMLAFVRDRLRGPMETGSPCLVRFVTDTPYVYLEGEFPEKLPARLTRQMTFPEVVEAYEETGFVLFLRDKGGYYRIPGVMTEMIRREYGV